MNEADRRSPAGRIVMLGPDLDDLGGMASVVQGYTAAWQHDRYALRYIGTYDSNAAQLTKAKMALVAFMRYLWLLVAWRPHVLHVHYSAGVSFLRKSVFMLVGRLARQKIVMHCHAPNMDTFYVRRTGVFKRYLDWILRAADLHIVVARSWQTFFEELGLGVPVLTLYNAVPLPPAPDRSDRPFPVLLTLGRLGQRKGTYDTLKAIPHILAQYPEAQFWLGGDGEVEQVRQIADAADWGDHLRLLGWVSGAEKDDVLARADVFLLPSYGEGLPVAVIEAMAYGLPVISTPVGGIPELVVDGETGNLIKPGDVDALVTHATALLASPQRRAEMGAAARAVIQRDFELGSVMEQLYAAYATLIEGNTPQ